jgi:uncharacterized tellurite resistance protein B-like protein
LPKEILKINIAMIYFEPHEVAAIHKAALTMVESDGLQHRTEKRLVMEELDRFGVPESALPSLFNAAREMDYDTMISIWRDFGRSQTIYALGYLAELATRDGSVDEPEAVFWFKLNDMVGYQGLTPEMAIEFWQAH